jgi:hypothetical protein
LRLLVFFQNRWLLDILWIATNVVDYLDRAFEGGPTVRHEVGSWRKAQKRQAKDAAVAGPYWSSAHLIRTCNRANAPSMHSESGENGAGEVWNRHLAGIYPEGCSIRICPDARTQ